MTELEMMQKFIDIAKQRFPELDETSLEYDLRVCGIDRMGPCCSDYKLMEMFRLATDNKVDESILYIAVEEICVIFTQEFMK